MTRCVLLLKHLQVADILSVFTRLEKEIKKHMFETHKVGDPCRSHVRRQEQEGCCCKQFSSLRNNLVSF
jgi:hypothetical protein